MSAQLVLADEGVHVGTDQYGPDVHSVLCAHCPNCDRQAIGPCEERNEWSIGRWSSETDRLTSGQYRPYNQDERLSWNEYV